MRVQARRRDAWRVAVPARRTALGAFAAACASAASLAMLPRTARAASRTWRVGPDETLRTPSAAARVAQDGDVVEVQAGDYPADVAVWPQRRVTLRAVGGRARLVAEGRSAEGKAIWVLRNGAFAIEGFDFVGVRVPDRNGAGVRFEGGTLRVSDCRFLASESGVLTANHGDMQLVVERCEFAHLGDGRGFAHALYAGTIARLQVWGCHFHHGRVGHLIKSRAAVSEIRTNRLSDEAGGRASYEIDLPNGGEAWVVGNLIQQSPDTENSALLSFGQEGWLPQLRRRLVLCSNTLVNDARGRAAWVRTASGTERVVSGNNLLVGRGRHAVIGGLQSWHDRPLTKGDFVDPGQMDYRLVSRAAERARFVGYPREAGADERWLPGLEYVHPRSTRPIPGSPRYAGAFQTTSS
jgi:hypothetical protein